MKLTYLSVICSVVVYAGIVMPYAMANDRPTRYWEYKEIDGTDRIGTFTGSDTENSEWVNITGSGGKNSFVFVRRTTRFTELYDRSRSMTVLIYDDGYTEWSVGQKWNRGADGKWMKMASPSVEVMRDQALLGIKGDFLPHGNGFKVSGVFEGAAASRLIRSDTRVNYEVKAGDVILAANGKRVRSLRHLMDALNAALDDANGMVKLTLKEAATGKVSEYIVKPNVSRILVPADDAPDPLDELTSPLPKAEFPSLVPAGIGS